MPCSGKRCVPAVDIALQGSQKQEALAKKLCGLIDLIALIRDQMVLDQNNNLETPGATTQALAAELARQIDALGELYNADQAGVASQANDAQFFGITCEINCRLLNVMIKQCYAQNGTANFTLGDIGNGTVNYLDTTWVVTPAEFLCCVSEHFARLQSFLERYVDAKKCETPC